MHSQHPNNLTPIQSIRAQSTVIVRSPVIILACLILLPLTTLAQQTATTKNGKVVILNNDGTWQYKGAKRRSGVPTQAHAKAAFVNKFQRFINSGEIKIIQFRKTNGQKGKLGGVTLYNIEYEAKVVYPKGVNTQCLKQKRKKTFFGPCPPGSKIFAPGEGETLKNSMTFELTKKGGRGDDGQIYR